MPPQREPIKRKARKPKPKPYVLPKTHTQDKPPTRKPKAGPPTPSPRRRPAPAVQPGPVREMERKKVERFKKKPEYRESLREARKHGPKKSRGTVQLGEGATGKSDEARERGVKYVARLRARQGGLTRGERTTVPPDVARRVGARRIVKRRKAEFEQKVAPALKALEQTTRPLHGVAAGTRAAIKGKNVPKAIGRGLANKDKSTFSDVLKDVGVPKGIAGPAGFALDVAADPTTYVTGGVGSVARKGALKAATKATRKATPTPVRAPTTVKEAKRAHARAQGGGAEAPSLAERAAARKLRADQKRGISLRFAGRVVPGVTRATAKVGEAVKKAPKPKVVRRAGEGVRRAAAEVNPNIAPRGANRAQYEAAREATRTARAGTQRDIFRAQQTAQAIRKQEKRIAKKHGDDATQRVLDAIEARKIGKLPTELRETAKALRDQYRHARRLERRSGIAVADVGGRGSRGGVRGYVPHVPTFALGKGEREARKAGGRTVRPGYAKERQYKQTLAEVRKTDPDLFSEDAAAIYADRMVKSAVSRNRAELNRRLLDIGRRVRPGQAFEVKPGESIWHVKGSDIRQVTDHELAAFLNGRMQKGGQYVALDDAAAKRAVEGMVPKAKGGHIIEALDKVQGGWKWFATIPNPGFHVRNFAGDLQNAYLATTAPKLVKNVVKSGKVLRHLNRQEAALRTFETAFRGNTLGATIKVGGKRVPVEDVIREAERSGAIRSGYHRELMEQMGRTDADAGLRKAGTKAGRGLRRAIQNREDVVRLATFIAKREEGLSVENAAAAAAKYHFDYQDLTALERNVLRRALPFYTFSARNIPLQLRSYIERPGKFANYQKIREEMAKAFGIDLDKMESGLEEFEQRSAPLPVKWKGHEFTVSLGPSGLPLTDLNEMPMGADPTKWADEWFQRGMSMVTPIAKSPLELGANINFFFRDQIESEESPLVPAPKWVAKLPKPLRSKLGVVDDYVDKRTGKKVVAWPAKADYIANQLPGPVHFAKEVSREGLRPGQSFGGRLLRYAGPRVKEVDPVTTKINQSYDERGKVKKKMNALNQRGVTAQNATPEYEKLREQYNTLDDQIRELRQKRGDKIIPGRVGRPKKPGAGGFAWPEDEGGDGGFKWPDKN